MNGVAKPMGLGLEEAAEGIFRVVNATMIRGIRLVSVEKGYDPREFTLVCFGGAGPVHAVKLAQELNIHRVLVPEGPGVNCALGLLMADFRHDYSRTFLHVMSGLDPSRLTKAFADLEARATEQMLSEGLAREAVVFHRSAELRYLGQGYEWELPFPGGHYDSRQLRTLADQFGQLHKDNYGYTMDPDSVEIVNLRLVAVGLLDKPEIKSEEQGPPDPARAYKEQRRVYMDGRFREVPIYERSRMRCGMEIPSPAIIEQIDSTTVIFPGYSTVIDRYRNLIITRRETKNAGH
jgi:N-methylhydantoinase A